MFFRWLFNKLNKGVSYIQSNIWFTIIKYLLPVNILCILYFLVAGWQDAWPYRNLIPFIYLFNPDLYRWQLYSILILPSIVTFCWWRPKPFRGVFLYVAFLLELLKHAYIILMAFFVVTMSRPELLERNQPQLALEILIFLGIGAIFYYIKKRRDLFIADKNYIVPSWKMITIFLIALTIITTYLPRVEYATRIQSLKTGMNDKVEMLPLQKKDITNLAFSPDSKYIAVVVDSSKEISIWDSTSKQLVNTFESEYFVKMVAFSPDGNYLVAGTTSSNSDKERTGLEAWDLRTNQKIDRFKRSIPSVSPRNTVERFFFSPDGIYVAALTNIGEKISGVEIWNFSTGELIKSSKGIRFNWFTNGRYLIGDTKKIQVKNMGSESIIKTFDFSGDRNKYVPSSFNSFDGRYLALNVIVNEINNSYKNTIEIWDMEKMEYVSTLDLSTNPKFDVTGYTHDDKHFVHMGFADPEIKFFDIATGKIDRILKHPATRVKALAFSPNGKKLAAGGDRMVVIWDVE